MSGPTLNDWLFPVRPERGPASAHREIIAGGDRAGRGALASECQRVADAMPGERDHTLNLAAFRMGQLVAGGHLELATVVAELTNAGLACGQSQAEVGRALRTDEAGGLSRGQLEPRRLEPREAGPGPLTSWTPPVVIGQEIDVAPPNEFDEPDAEGVRAAVKAAFPVLDWHALWADEAEDEWILEPLVAARRLVALYSPPKVGKSLLLLEIAAHLAEGTPCLGVDPGRKVRTLYVDFENDPRGDVRARLRALGFSPDQLEHLAYLSFPSFAAFDTPNGGAQLLAVARAYDVELVVIDTISRAIAGEENANDTWLAFYRNTGAPLKAAGIAVLRLDHSGKDVERGMRGGSAKYSDVDAVWQLSEVEPDKAFKLLCTDNRFPIAEKELILRRETNPLRHRVDPEGSFGVYRGKLEQTIGKLDEMDIAPSAGIRGAAEALRESGFNVAQHIVATAQKNRRARMEPEEPEED